MALTDNLVSYWKFDESSGNAADSVGSNTLTNNNTITYAAAKINNGADMESGSSQYFSAADSAGLSFTGDMSWSFWLKPESDTQAVLMMKIGSSGQRAYYGQLLSSTTVRLGISSNGTTVTIRDVTVPTVTMDGTTWVHIVMVYDASAGSVEVFTNGTSRGTNTGLPTSIFDGTTAFEFGSYQEGGARSNYYDGALDEMGAWNRVLTSAEVTSLYNSGAGLAYPFSAGGPANLKSLDGNLKANIKSIDGNLIANVKSLDTNV